MGEKKNNVESQEVSMLCSSIENVKNSIVRINLFLLLLESEGAKSEPVSAKHF